MITIGNNKLKDSFEFYSYIKDKVEVLENFRHFDVVSKLCFNESLFEKNYEFTEKCKLNPILKKFSDKGNIFGLRFIYTLSNKNHKFYYFVRGFSFEECQQLSLDKNSPIFIDYWKKRKCLDIVAEKYAKEAFFNFNIVKLNFTSHWSLDFWLSRGYNEISAKEKISELQKNNSNKWAIKLKNNLEDYVSKFSTRIEFWLDKGFSEEEAKIKLSERQSTFSLDKCISKLGESEGRIRWQERQELWQKTLQSNPNINEINKRKDSSSIEWALKKCDGDIESAKALKNERDKLHDSSSMEWALKKCDGDVNEATKLRNDRVLGRNKKSYSKESILFFLPLYNFCLDLGIPEDQIYWKETEYVINEQSKIYFYDFTLRDLCIIIEYHGVAFHPKHPNQDWKSIFTNHTAREKYEYDQLKNNVAKSKGFNLIEVWSDEDLILRQNELKLLIETTFKRKQESEENNSNFKSIIQYF